jgi:nicotinamide-nucleotide amidase
MDFDLVTLSEQVGMALRKHSLTLATAESCTGGWVAQVVTHTPGSSQWFDRGFVTYADSAKMQMLGVDERTLRLSGAVSVETAREMAIGALANSNALISLSITGVAGPTGGSPDKPVGTVCFAWCRRGQEPDCEERHFAGCREGIRRQAVVFALEGLLARAK